MPELYMCTYEDMEKVSVHKYHAWLDMFMTDPDLEGMVHCTDLLIELDGNFYRIKHWFYIEHGDPVPIAYSKELVIQC